MKKTTNPLPPDVLARRARRERENYYTIDAISTCGKAWYTWRLRALSLEDAINRQRRMLTAWIAKAPSHRYGAFARLIGMSIEDFEFSGEMILPAPLPDHIIDR